MTTPHPIRRRTFLASLAALAATPGSGFAAPEAKPGRRFACTDYTAGKVAIIAADGTVEWEYAASSCNDLWVLPNGNLLFNTGRGAREVTRDKETVFNYDSTGEVFACQRLADGKTFVGECSLGRLLEIEPDGRVSREVKLLPQGKDGGHGFMRNARRLDNGHFLVAHYGAAIVKEYDPAGRVVREIPAKGGPHSVVRLPDGNTLVTCADQPGGSRIFEADPAGKVVWEIKGEELPGISLKFVAGVHRLPNGNTVLCNWLGHGQFGKAPHLVEVTRDKQVVWTYADHRLFRTISNVQILDLPGNPAAGTLLH